jgi:hypothetical protein
MKQSIYDHIWDSRADIYDFVFMDRKEDIQFYLGMAEECGDPVFEGGCATGRILLPIVRNGFVAYGVDASQPMLDHFHEKIKRKATDVQQRLHISKGNLLETIAFDVQFSMIFLSFGTFGLFLNDGEAEQVLQNLAGRLDRDGKLIIERRNRLSDKYFAKPQLNWTRYWQARKCTVVESQTSVIIDDHRKIREQTFYYDIFSPAGDIKRFSHRLYFREFSLLEISYMLKRIGLTVVDVYGDYDRTPYQPTMPRIIVIAQFAT